MKPRSARRRIPRQARARATYDEILDATRRVLEDDGPEAVNTNRLAAEVGISVGSLYAYFPNKEAIVRALFEHLSNDETTAVLRRIEETRDRSLADAVRAAIEATFDLYRRNHAVVRALYAMTSVVRDIGHRPGEERLLEAMRRRLAPEAKRLGLRDVRRACFVVFHLVDSLAARMLEERGRSRARDREWTDAACVDEMTRAVFGYLGLWRGPHGASRNGSRPRPIRRPR